MHVPGAPAGTYVHPAAAGPAPYPGQPEQYTGYVPPPHQGQAGGPRHGGRPPPYYSTGTYPGPQNMYVQVPPQMMAPHPTYVPIMPMPVMVVPTPVQVGLSPRAGPIPVSVPMAPGPHPQAPGHVGPRHSPTFVAGVPVAPSHPSPAAGAVPTAPSPAAGPAPTTPGTTPSKPSGVPVLNLGEPNKAAPNATPVAPAAPVPPTTGPSAQVQTPVPPHVAAAAAAAAPQQPAVPAHPASVATPATQASTPEEAAPVKPAPSVFDTFAEKVEKGAKAAAEKAAAEKAAAAAGKATPEDDVNERYAVPVNPSSIAAAAGAEEEKRPVASAPFMDSGEEDFDEDEFEDEDEDFEDEPEDDYPVFIVENNRYTIEQMLTLRDYACAPDPAALATAAKMISEILTQNAPKTRPPRPTKEEWRNGSPPPRRPPRGRKRLGGVDTSDLPGLSTCENAYKVARDVEGDERKLRDLQSILNKLTAQNLEKLSKDAININIDNDGLMRRFVQLVFQKAVKEPNFSPYYAEFCRRLADLKLESSVAGETPRTFRQLILHQLQESFQSRSFATPEEFAQMTPEQQEEEQQKKKDILGTIRFVGELFIRGMIKVRIMYDCLEQLLPGDGRPIIEKDLEVLCKLLTTIGETLQLNRTPSYDKTLDRMRELSQDKEHLSTRIRFMLLDVLDMEARGWQPSTGAPPPTPAQPAGKGGDKGDKGAPAGGKRASLSRANSSVPGIGTQPTAQSSSEEWSIAGDKHKRGQSSRGTRGAGIAGTQGSMQLTRSQSSAVTSPRGGQPSGAKEAAPAAKAQKEPAPGPAVRNAPAVESEAKVAAQENPADLEKTINHILRVFVKDDNDVDEAVSQLSQLSTNISNGLVLSEGFKLVADAKAPVRELFTKLIERCVELKCTDGRPFFESGVLAPVLPGLLSTLTDLVIDIPFVFANFAQCVGPILDAGLLGMNDFLSDAVLEALKDVFPPSDSVVKMFGEIAVRMKERHKPDLSRLATFIGQVCECEPDEIASEWVSFNYNTRVGEQLSS